MSISKLSAVTVIQAILTYHVHRLHLVVIANMRLSELMADSDGLSSFRHDSAEAADQNEML